MIDAPPERVWTVLMDPVTLCRLADSCEEARQIDETHYEGIVRVRMSLVRLRIQVQGTVVKALPPRELDVSIAGESQGIPGKYSGDLHLVLLDDGAGTLGEYRLTAELFGPLGALGAPVLQAAAQRLAASFAAKVSAYLTSSTERP